MSMEQESRDILKGNMAGFADLYFARPFDVNPVKLE